MRTRFSRGLSAVLAVSALSLTAACGGGDDTKKEGADKPAAAAPTSQAPATPLTDAQMKAGALELKDLPAGWKVKKADDDKTNYKADKAECQPLADMMNPTVQGATLGPSADFALGNNSSELSQEVMTFSGTGASDFTRKIVTALGSCQSFTVEGDGQKMTLGAKKLTAPQGAEEAITVGLSLEVAPGIKIEPNLLVVRQGTGVFRMLHLADAAAAKKDFDGLAKTAVDKFVKAVQG